jgi:hypothetical protein
MQNHEEEHQESDPRCLAQRQRMVKTSEGRKRNIRAKSSGRGQCRENLSSDRSKNMFHEESG